VPVSVDGKPMKGSDVIRVLNKLAVKTASGSSIWWKTALWA
jgi:hypothetical protein